MSPVATIGEETTMCSRSGQESSDDQCSPLRGTGLTSGKSISSTTDSVLDSLQSDTVSRCDYSSVDAIQTPSTPISSDKITIIRLNDELLKSKRSNWEVVDALSKAYEDLRKLRLKEQCLSRVTFEETVTAKINDTLVNGSVSHIQYEVIKKEFLRVKTDLVSVTAQRDSLRESLSDAQRELRLLSFENTRKESALELAKDRIKYFEEDVRLNIDQISNFEERACFLEQKLTRRDRQWKELSSEYEALEGRLLRKEREIKELQRDLSFLKQKKEPRPESMQTENVHIPVTEGATTTASTEEQHEARVAEEEQGIRDSLEELRAKREEDNKVISTLKAQILQWERYGARYERRSARHCKVILAIFSGVPLSPAQNAQFGILHVFCLNGP